MAVHPGNNEPPLSDPSTVRHFQNFMSAINNMNKLIDDALMSTRVRANVDADFLIKVKARLTYDRINMSHMTNSDKLQYAKVWIDSKQTDINTLKEISTESHKSFLKTLDEQIEVCRQELNEIEKTMNSTRTNKELQYALPMGFFNECIVTTIKLDNTKQPPRPSAEYKIYVFDDKALFRLGKKLSDEKSSDKNYRKLAGGLMVSTYGLPLVKSQSYSLPVRVLKDRKFEFVLQYVSKYKNDILYHLVLPEYCYIDENAIDEIKQQKTKGMTIYTYERNQSITFTYPSDFVLRMRFIGPDEGEFSKIKKQRRPRELDERAFKVSNSKV